MRLGRAVQFDTVFAAWAWNSRRDTSPFAARALEWLRKGPEVRFEEVCGGIRYSIINMEAYSVVTMSLIFVYCAPDTTCFVTKSAGS
jgi:hypothetical protein